MSPVVLVDLCVGMCLLAAGLYIMFCLFVVLLLSSKAHIYHCNYLIGKEEAGLCSVNRNGQGYWKLYQT